MNERSVKMNNINYQKVFERTIEHLKKENKVPKLLLHSCCAPCSSYVIDYVSEYFDVTVFYYNPNIDEKEEYHKRAKEQQKLIECMPTKFPVKFVEGDYDVEAYTKKAAPLSTEKEGGARCFMCYGMRLKKTAVLAKEEGFDYFTTTLTISPLKNAAKLNEIGRALEEQYDVSYLYSDFKKKEGYKKSVALSEQYGLYRQDYCGCSYSKQEIEQYKS